MFNQKGLVGMMAILVLTATLAFVAFMMPIFTEMIKTSKINSDSIEAKFAAESGVTRALVAMRNSATDWSWLNRDRQLKSGTANKIYNVVITNTSTGAVITTNGVLGPGTYSIRSTGKIGTGTISQATSTETFTIKANGLPIYGNSYLQVESRVAVNNGGIITTALNQGSSNVLTHSSLTIKYSTPLSLPTMPTDFKYTDYSNRQNLTNYPNSGTLTLSGNYIVTGDFGTNDGVKLYVASGKKALIYVSGGSARINDEIKADGELTIIADNEIAINSSSATATGTGTIKLYSKNALYLNRPMSGATIIAMTPKDLTFNSSGKIGKIAAYSGSRLTVNSGVTITGTVFAEELILNGGTINYDSGVAFP